MTRKIKEKSVQNYLYENLENLPDLIKLENLQSQYKLDREDLVFRPLKYLLNKKYQNIFEKMTNF
jgi:5-methylthioribose kinase